MLLVIIISVLCLKQNILYTNVRFVMQPKLNANKLVPKSIFESFLIPQPSYLMSAHSATLEILPDGSLVALWFAGSHEGKPDVKIWQAYFRNESWGFTTAVVSPEGLMSDTRMLIKKVGNPVIYKAANNLLHLFVVSVSIGGWSGSSINHLISKDNGKTWFMAKKIMLSPFFNISTLIRSKAIGLSDGGFYLPVYHELICNYPELLYFNANGDFIKQYRINNTNHLIQPSVLVISPESAYVYFRNHTVAESVMFMQQTDDGGVTWGKILATNITNQDSSLATVNLSDGNLLMVRNLNGRNKLVLSVSSNGYIWRDIYYLEKVNSEAEFSYPSIQVHDGVVDIVYTWQRKYIKHVRFNLAWLYTKMH